MKAEAQETLAPKRVCILSCGRSGTVYTAELLNASGFKVGHEADGPDGDVGGTFWKGQVRDLDSYDHIIHQVREPMKTISSLTTCKENTFEKYYKYFGMECYGASNSLETSAMMWLLYTTWADSLSEYTFRVESIESKWSEICSYFGKEVPVEDIATDINSRRHDSYSIDDLCNANRSLAELVRLKAVLYGYRE